MADETRIVSFEAGPVDVIGVLHLPHGFNESRIYPAIVIVTPGSSVKEQIGATYGARLAAKGFVALAFDPSYQGESGGEPRDLEDPSARVEDVCCAIDYLVTLAYVDEERIGVLGICAGGGYAVKAALTERRIKAVGTVVPVNIGRAFRQAQVTDGAIDETLAAVGRQRTAEARGGAERRDPWLPDSLDDAEAAGIVDPDTLEAIAYYRTPPGYNANASNRLLFRSNALLLGFDAFHLVAELLPQPLQVIVAGRRGTTFSYEDGEDLWHRARNRKDFTVIAGAGHYELYDKPEYVDQATDRLGAFFRVWL
ncbi:alpha/beta hydrolase [Sphingomonas prati]|uniref:PET hydrolase/cutinase-like domain-containing protein n=1 Tax=Sphingomonas prati TaxID=1843237 RepID=A0A7W9F132_9SPHN|nr:alpha/beta hydrolase [Sphingomonas prati]MBB5729047.1 hypothetical protein [Sphingomonas prati]GGE85490.1 alpha/beta hydrolase [Sphingomonas prati]